MPAVVFVTMALAFLEKITDQHKGPIEFRRTGQFLFYDLIRFSFCMQKMQQEVDILKMTISYSDINLKERLL